MAITYMKCAEQAPKSTSPEISQVVKNILEDVKQQGIKAVRKYSFGKWETESFCFYEEKVDKALWGTKPVMQTNKDSE
jgi:sulfopropanediol 3-dehydrogenase